MRGLFIGGGTGGHFYPAFSIAKELNRSEDKVVFIIKENDISINILKEEDIAFVEMDMIAFPRTLNPIRFFIFLWKLIKSTLYANRIISDFMPDYIFLTGSYLSASFILPAYIKKIPLYLHESNSKFGIGNYIAGFVAKKIFLGLPIKNNPHIQKSKITGTPIREIFFSEIKKDEILIKLKIKPTDTVITCFGGSQGSRNINNAIYYFLLENKSNGIKNITLIHITGKKNYDEIKKKYEEAGLLNDKLIVFDYYENMAELYSISNLIVSRSGASTIAELIYTKRPAILIPLPHAANNHQYENARFLFEHGCAMIIKDDENLPINLIKNINFLLQRDRLRVMEKSYERIQIPKGKEVIKEIISEIRGINKK